MSTGVSTGVSAGVSAGYHALAALRWRVALALTVAVIVLYFGFIALIAYKKEVMARLLVPGLSVGILLGALVIVCSWLLTWLYVWWANARYDARLDALRRENP